MVIDGLCGKKLNVRLCVSGGQHGFGLGARIDFRPSHHGRAIMDHCRMSSLSSFCGDVALGLSATRPSEAL